MASTYVDAILDRTHRARLDWAVHNVLATERALETFAQIADGLPLKSVALDRRTSYAYYDAVARHTSLCPGATEAALDFLSTFDLGRMLTFDRALLRAYQWSRPESGPNFECRLIELVARAVHGLAVLLYQRRYCIHDQVWAAKDPTYTVKSVTKPHPGSGQFRSPFYLPDYEREDQYPDGIADVVGYWAENRILGGVVLFDRSDSWDDQRNPEPNVFFHSSYRNVTIRVWRALDEQQQALVDFLLSRSPEEACPLPLLASDKNLDRVDVQYATHSKVYRDFWERRLPPAYGRFQEPHCVRDRLDYP
ncbi:hypothetical protein NEMBOFW57_001632 [Staphylotrichum longicolle]|uniref:Uncharacterized protein n=1 Tax=Staphylotrichum longicolle TaxID=669026 RepID=A0AAD4F1J2_9PEZI|nr:hypothetical protein NEMBOFW57_001632 [Staphylotrichum longicolle]